MHFIERKSVDRGLRLQSLFSAGIRRIQFVEKLRMAEDNWEEKKLGLVKPIVGRTSLESVERHFHWQILFVRLPPSPW